MVEFGKGEIKDIMPVNLRSTEAESVSYALGEAMRQMRKYSFAIRLYAGIGYVPEDVLDLMALELNAQFYNQSFPRSMKEQIVLNTVAWYMKAGTPSAVEELITVVLGKGEVIEWFEYGGEPYWFKVRTDAAMTEDGISCFFEMIQKIKNTRSHLGAIEFTRNITIPVYAGCGEISVIYPEAVMDGYKVGRNVEQTIFAGAGETGRFYVAAPVMEKMPSDGLLAKSRAMEQKERR